MSKILGLDLGTNSIGWAIRDTDTLDENQIIDYGVVIFQKGVGDGKSGEYSLAAERRQNRSKRRLYNAKRYRKWELLKVLIENGMCPLTGEELRLWSVGNWEEVNSKKKNMGKIYPIGNEDFQKWLAFDPVYFGHKGKIEINHKGVPSFKRKNPYDIRFELIENKEQNDYTKKQKLGRALYHLVQRRGFKSSRKSGKSVYAENVELERIKSENSNFHITTLAKDKLDKGERFRASGVIQRRYFEDEFFAICKTQNLSSELTEKLYKAIYYVRPLRSQKGLVGNCTLEKGKARIPISHPKFEELRALQFINNIQWRETGSNKKYDFIPISLKKKIFEELFFRRLESGKNRGKVNADSYFKFDEIIDKYSQNGKYEFNYKNRPNVSTCPTIASLMNVFENEWQNKFIQDENAYGINWEGLSINYKIKYGKKTGKERTLRIDEIWHLLFDYIQTNDKQEDLEKLCKNVLDFCDEKAKLFSEIDIPQGYGSLSYSAISKIIPFLQDGFIYSEAVSFANLKKVLGDKFEANKEKAKKIIAGTMKETEKTKEKLNIVNELIQQFFAENNTTRAKGVDNHIKEMAAQDTIDKLKKYFGETDWNNKSEAEQKQLEGQILNLYLKFLDGKQDREEKASSRLDKKPEIDYYRLPRLDEAIKQNLKEAFDLSDDTLKRLYHPSDIEMYPKSKSEVKTRIDGIETWVKQLESPQPPSKGWKNPMAMRTLHELRHLMNYLLKVGKVDNETKIVVEMARELNDANKRWAIQTYQRYREEENKEFAKAIVVVAKQKYPNLDENNIENINKVRLWWEQVENNLEVYKEIKALKEDVQKYRLWKEQECLCMYTGETINLVDLFDGTQTHFEHTLPVSDSFDNSLSNLTVCKAHYNTNIKKDSMPTQLANYSKDANGHSAIKPRLKKWEEKVEHLKNLIDDNKKRTKKTQDPETKKDLIKKRHLLQFDYDYWKKKLETFTTDEIPNKWKNSQLVDTQIISKYARAYLKTVFERADVQKGTIVNDFKKIYQIKGDEQKDRSKHSHHAIDAATLTLIPGSARREAILKEYYTALENKSKFYTKPYEKFETAHILDIENNIIINHVSHDKTLIATIKNIRKRGEKEYIKIKDVNGKWQYKLDEKGGKIPKVAQGDSIRGQLHKDSFFGAIKVPMRNHDGFAVKENGIYQIEKDAKTGQEVIWTVKRDVLDKVDLTKVIDQVLAKHIVEQKNSKSERITDFAGNEIRHIRYKVALPSYDKSLKIKSHTYPSKYTHKKKVITDNSENYICLSYQGVDSTNKSIAAFRFLSLFEFSRIKNKNLWKNNDYNIFIKVSRKKEIELTLKNIITSGLKVILYKSSVDEIDRQHINIAHMYKVYKFNNSGADYIFIQNIIEARPNNELGDGETSFDPNKYQPRLKLTADNFNCLFEGIDFEIKPDGKVKWL